MAKHVLTEKAVRTAKVPAGRSETTLYDGEGLALRVRRSEADPSRLLKAWAFWYERGKRQKIGLGAYPEVSLSAARDQAEHYRQLLKAGITPTGKASPAVEGAPLIPRTVEELAERWQRDFLVHKRKDKGAAVMASLERHVLPSIGKTRLADLRKAHVLHVVNVVNARGTGRTAKLTLATIRQMFKWAVRTDYMAADPTAGLAKEDYGGKPRIRTRTLSADELRDLAKRMQVTKRGGPVGRQRDIPTVPLWTQAAVWTMLATLARVGELSQARWEHVDTEAGMWFIPAENSKNGNANLIHLSAFAERHLAYLRVFAAGSPWVMPARDPAEHIDLKAITKSLRDRQAERQQRGRSVESSALLLPGGIFTSHDLRRTGATMMQALGVAAPVIERCLNHTEQDRMAATYQQDELLPQRAAAFAKLGKKLDELVPAVATAHLDISMRPK